MLRVGMCVLWCVMCDGMCGMVVCCMMGCVVCDMMVCVWYGVCDVGCDGVCVVMGCVVCVTGCFWCVWCE